MAKKKQKAKKAKKAAGKTVKKKAPKKAGRKTPKKAANKAAKKASKAKKAPKERTPIAPMLPGMAEGIEAEEFEPEVGLVADDEEDEDIDFPEVEEITATPDLETPRDDDEGEW